VISSTLVVRIVALRLRRARGIQSQCICCVHELEVLCRVGLDELLHLAAGAVWDEGPFGTSKGLVSKNLRILVTLAGELKGIIER
jgi:hypothetical protein